MKNQLKMFVCPLRSFSPSWSAANISDCLALRKALGPVTLFITFTTNPRWPEITSQLRPGQSANDRPDLIVRVFQQYLSAFMKDLHATMGPVFYHVRVTEFQKRGLPHEHIALALQHVPRTPAEIDSFLSAELPRNSGPLRDAVKRHMTHIHDPKKTYHRCGWPRECQYGYPKSVKAESSFNEHGLESNQSNLSELTLTLMAPSAECAELYLTLLDFSHAWRN
jgi:hypothetical protein